MGEMGRWMMFAGGALFVVGVLFWPGGRLPWFGNLPGDIVVKRDNFTLYAPLGTMLLLSVLLTIALNKVGKADFNSYGSRRGNHEVMMRGA